MTVACRCACRCISFRRFFFFSSVFPRLCTYGINAFLGETHSPAIAALSFASRILAQFVGQFGKKPSFDALPFNRYLSLALHARITSRLFANDRTLEESLSRSLSRRPENEKFPLSIAHFSRVRVLRFFLRTYVSRVHVRACIPLRT